MLIWDALHFCAISSWPTLVLSPSNGGRFNCIIILYSLWGESIIMALFVIFDWLNIRYGGGGGGGGNRTTAFTIINF